MYARAWLFSPTVVSMPDRRSPERLPHIDQRSLTDQSGDSVQSGDVPRLGEQCQGFLELGIKV